MLWLPGQVHKIFKFSINTTNTHKERMSIQKNLQPYVLVRVRDCYRYGVAFCPVIFCLKLLMSALYSF